MSALWQQQCPDALELRWLQFQANCDDYPKSFLGQHMMAEFRLYTLTSRGERIIAVNDDATVSQILADNEVGQAVAVMRKLCKDW